MAYLPTAVPDETAFSEGASPVVPAGGVFDDSLGAVTTGETAQFRITEKRALHSNLRAEDGTEIGTAAAPLGENLVQLAGTAVDVNSGNKSAGTQRVVLATDQPALANWRENVTYSDDAIKPRFAGNRIALVNVFTALSGALVPALASNYIFITSIQLSVQIDTIKTTAGDFDVSVLDGANTAWFSRMFVPSAVTLPSLTTSGLVFSTPPGFFYNCQNINTALTWLLSDALTGGRAEMLICYGYTTLLF